MGNLRSQIVAHPEATEMVITAAVHIYAPFDFTFSPVAPQPVSTII